MGLDLSIYKVKKYKNVPFGVIYNQVTDGILVEFLKDNEEQKNKEIQYYKDEGFYTGEFLDKIIKRTEKRYKKYEEMVEKYNKEYNQLNEEEKKEIKKLEQLEIQSTTSSF